MTERHGEFRPCEALCQDDVATKTRWPSWYCRSNLVFQFLGINYVVPGVSAHRVDRVSQRRARIRDRDALLSGLTLKLRVIALRTLAIFVAPPIGGNRPAGGRLEVEYRPCDGYG